MTTSIAGSAPPLAAFTGSWPGLVRAMPPEAEALPATGGAPSR